MEYNKKGGESSHQGRRDYDKHPAGKPSGRKHFTTTRKTSPEHGAERVFTTDRAYDSTDRPVRRFDGERRPYDGERRSFDGERRPYDGERRPYDGERRRFDGERKPYDRERRSFDGDRRSFHQGQGSRKPGRKPQAPKSGIDAMISRRPQVDRNAYSDNDQVKTPIQEVIRLNKFIANSGVCSRREADTLIQSGVVTVNGEVVTELGSKVNVLMDEVRFNGQRLKGEEKVYIVMNKPKGYVTTAGDPHAEKTVMDLIKGCPKRVFPVGRLDKNTTGVLMFTNDGEMAEKLTHPSYNKKKIYQVTLDQPLEEADKEKILAGVELNDGVVKADELEYIDVKDRRKLGIEIHSGKNRVVRRIFESLGYDVKALDRVYFAGLTKKGLKKSDWRYLTEGEVNILKMGAYV